MADQVTQLTPEAHREIAKYGREELRRSEQMDSAPPTPLPPSADPVGSVRRFQEDFAAQSAARKSQGNRS